MNKLRRTLENNKTTARIVLCSYIIFNGCFIFPFSNELFPFTYDKALMVIMGYGLIGLYFSMILNKGKSFKVFTITFLFTVIGMICKYLLEFGEVSNVRNFIPINIFLYLAIVPLYTTIVYWLSHKYGINDLYM